MTGTRKMSIVETRARGRFVAKGLACGDSLASIAKGLGINSKNLDRWMDRHTPALKARYNKTPVKARATQYLKDYPAIKYDPKKQSGLAIRGARSESRGVKTHIRKDLSRSHCPYMGYADGAVTTCGKPTQDGAQYCEEHYAKTAPRGHGQMVSRRVVFS